MKVALYARVSSKDRGQETENRLVQLREFAAKQSWQITRECIDRETGGTSDRAQFQAMFADANRRKFDLVLFSSLDRLSREGVLETLQHLNRLTSTASATRATPSSTWTPAVSSGTPLSASSRSLPNRNASDYLSVPRPGLRLRGPRAVKSVVHGSRFNLARLPG